MLNYQRIIQWDKREKSRDEKKNMGKTDDKDDESQ
jgi:hypothetical protein